MFEQTEHKLENKDLIDFENKFDIVLPQNYKELMLKYNGGYTEEIKNFETLKSIKYGELKVETSILIHQNAERNIPENFLPIANDFSDNIICLNLEKSENYGKVYCFYFDVDKVELLSNSLEEFLGVNSIEELQLIILWI